MEERRRERNGDGEERGARIITLRARRRRAREHARTTRRTGHACSAYDNARRCLASTMRPAHKEAKSLLSWRESNVVGRGRFQRLNGEPSVYGSQSGKWRTQGNHARIPPLLSSPFRESEFYVLHTDEDTCPTARDTRFLSRSSPCHFPSSALSSALTPLEAPRLRHFLGRAGKQATPVMSIS